MYFLIDRAHVNKVQVISFTHLLWFHSMAALAMGLFEWKASSWKGDEAVGVAAMPPLPHCANTPILKIDASHALF